MRSVSGFRGAFTRLGICAVLIMSITATASAACTTTGASPQKVSDFIANPASLLAGPNGPRSGGEISADVRDLVTSDPATLPAVINLLKISPSPTSDQQKAIGTGLGLAAQICLRPDPTFANEIQTQLSATDSTDAKQQYAAVTGNVLIGGIGGGAGGVSGGASGGQTAPLASFNGGGSLQAFVPNGITNAPINYFSGGTSGASSISSSTTQIISPSGI